MSLVKELNKYDLQEEFRSFNRDYFSLEGYQAILDFFEEVDYNKNTDLDVIAICCDFNESTPDDIKEEYSNIDSIADAIDNDDLLDALNYYTWCIPLDNGNILYLNF